MEGATQSKQNTNIGRAPYKLRTANNMSTVIPTKISFRSMEQKDGETLISSLPWEGEQKSSRGEKKWNRGSKPRIKLGLKSLVRKQGARLGAYATFESSDVPNVDDLQQYLGTKAKTTNRKAVDLHTSNGTLETCEETVTENSAIAEEDAAFVCPSSPRPHVVPLEISPDSFSFLEVNGTRWTYSELDTPPHLELNIVPKKDGTCSPKRRRAIRSVLPPRGVEVINSQ